MEHVLDVIINVAVWSSCALLVWGAALCLRELFAAISTSKTATPDTANSSATSAFARSKKTTAGRSHAQPSDYLAGNRRAPL
jgi:hypothetical protein